MKPAKGYYSIIQFCPDRAKLEVANIGVLLLVPEIAFLDLRIASSNAKIHRIFGRSTFDVKNLNFLKDSIQKRLRDTEKGNIKSLQSLESFVSTRANDIIITNPRPIKVEEPQQELANLFDELVGDRSAVKRNKILFPYLESEFKSARFRNRIQFNATVEIPGLDRTLEIPYAYQNGRLNLIRPQEFGPQGIDTGLKLAAESELIQKHSSNNCERRLILLPKIEERVVQFDSMRSSLTNLFARFDVRMVWEEELPQFVDEVSQQAH